MPVHIPPPRLDRRQLLRSALALAPLVAWPGLLLAAAPSIANPATANPATANPRAARHRTGSDARRLAFYHTHTGETLDIVYSERGVYLPDALAEIHHLCRDFRTGDVHPIDPALLDLLDDVRLAAGRTTTGKGSRYEIISAYRSPVTNRRLSRTGSGVADRSLHLQGQAIDVRLPGVQTADLRRAALGLAGGGVGYYPESDFVHIDTGRVRRW